MKVVGYVRVSTDAQADKGFGLDVQRKALRDWCSTNGHKLVCTYEDAGVSGMADALDRPGLADAIAAIADKRANAVVVARMDRLARSLNVQEGALALVWQHGGRAFSADMGEIDCDDPMRTMIRQILGAVAQADRATTLARLRSARQAKAARGGYAHGAPPYGWRGEGGRLVKVPAEQKALRRIAELDAQGCSTREIAQWLSSERHPTKRGGHWSSAVVARIVRRLNADKVA